MTNNNSELCKVQRAKERWVKCPTWNTRQLQPIDEGELSSIVYSCLMDVEVDGNEMYSCCDTKEEYSEFISKAISNSNVAKLIVKEKK